MPDGMDICLVCVNGNDETIWQFTLGRLVGSEFNQFPEFVEYLDGIVRLVPDQEIVRPGRAGELPGVSCYFETGNGRVRYNDNTLYSFGE